MKNRRINLLARYTESTQRSFQVENLIPLGSQTFSKSRTQFPRGVAPLFVDRSKGCKTWDIDGNEYIDLVSSLAAVTLGYGDRDVNKAVRKQLKRGVTLSLPTSLEFEVAQLVQDLVPSCEKIRFGKTGSDACAAAVRLSRAYTGKNHVLVSGYHGWHDWFIGTTSMNLGVPNQVSELTHKFDLNDTNDFLGLIKKHGGDIAAVIVEPISSAEINKESLLEIKAVTKKHGIILIFDETVSGFRVAPGGAKELLGITPDLTVFGKGIANGFPLSAVAGNSKVMSYMDKVFYSGTFGGELLSLAAAKVVLNKIKTEDVTKRLEIIGNNLALKVNQVIEELAFEGLRMSGHPSWNFLLWDSSKFRDIKYTKTLFLQEMFSRGILIITSHNVTLKHDKSALDKITKAYKEVLTLIQKVEKENSYSDNLYVEPIEPLFKIRS